MEGEKTGGWGLAKGEGKSSRRGQGGVFITRSAEQIVVKKSSEQSFQELDL